MECSVKKIADMFAHTIPEQALKTRQQEYKLRTMTDVFSERGLGKGKRQTAQHKRSRQAE